MKNATYSKPELAAGTTYSRRGRMANAIKQYKGRFLKEGKNDNEGAFFLNDLYDIMDISGGDQYDLVSNALMAGFMVGYRKGKSDAKR